MRKLTLALVLIPGLLSFGSSALAQQRRTVPKTGTGCPAGQVRAYGKNVPICLPVSWTKPIGGDQSPTADSFRRNRCRAGGC